MITNMSSLFLASVPLGAFIGALVGAIVVVGAACFFIGRILYKKICR